MFCFMFPQVGKRWGSKKKFASGASEIVPRTFKTVAPPLALQYVVLPGLLAYWSSPWVVCYLNWV